MKEKLIILTIVIYLFNLLFVHGQVYTVDNFGRIIDTIVAEDYNNHMPSYQALKRKKVKEDYIDHFYSRSELKQQNKSKTFIEVIPTFGGNSVTQLLNYESGIMSEIKVSLHNQDLNQVNTSFPYYTSVGIGWANLSLEDELGRKVYDYTTIGLEVGTWYEAFVLYGFMNIYAATEKEFGTVGIGGGLKIPVSDKFTVNINGEFGTLVFDSPFVNKNKPEYYQNLTLGVGYKF